MPPSTQRFYYKQNRFKQLRAFCYAAQTGSISKAADKLLVSQPSVSLQVRALEQELDIAVFRRRGPRIELTPEGRILYELATPLVEGIDRLPDVFAQRCGNLERGDIDIAAGESTILYILPEYARRFAELYPNIRLRLHNVTGREGLAQIRADEVDFAIGSMTELPGDICYRPTVDYDIVLITSREHPLAENKRVELEDISPYGVILPSRYLATWRLVDTVFRKSGVDYRVTLETGGWEVIKKYVEIGLGVSILSSACLGGGEALAVRSMGKFFPRRSYGVVTRRGKTLSEAARRFIEMMAPGDIGEIAPESTGTSGETAL